MKLYTFKKGGVHPPQEKRTSGKAIVDIDLPRTVTLSMSQSIGSPSECRLQKGTHVNRGDLIGIASGYVSANIHTPISGTITDIAPVAQTNGIPMTAVTIMADSQDHFNDLQSISDSRPVRTDSDIDKLSPEEIVEIIRQAGIVGLGGATFPTDIKLTPPKGMIAEVVIINGAECEPYLTCDDAIMRELSVEITDGIRYLMKAAKVKKAIVAIENNKPEAINAMQQATHRYPDIEIAICKTKYPEGGEKQLIKAVIGREVPSGALPISVGAIVDNVATVLAIYHAVKWGIPLMERVLTVTGPDVTNPGNFRVPVGTNLSDVVAFAGGIPESTGKIIIGGPMMGRTAITIDAPSTKGISGIVLMPEKSSKRAKTEPCVRCARCVEACPMGLEPYLISILSRQLRFDEASENHITDCIECGCCTYTCPSSRPLLDYIRIGKSTVIAHNRAKK